MIIGISRLFSRRGDRGWVVVRAAALASNIPSLRRFAWVGVGGLDRGACPWPCRRGGSPIHTSPTISRLPSGAPSQSVSPCCAHQPDPSLRSPPPPQGHFFSGACFGWARHNCDGGRALCSAGATTVVHASVTRAAFRERVPRRRAAERLLVHLCI